MYNSERNRRNYYGLTFTCLIRVTDHVTQAELRNMNIQAPSPQPTVNKGACDTPNETLTDLAHAAAYSKLFEAYTPARPQPPPTHNTATHPSQYPTLTQPIIIPLEPITGSQYAIPSNRVNRPYFRGCPRVVILSGATQCFWKNQLLFITKGARTGPKTN